MGYLIYPAEKDGNIEFVSLQQGQVVVYRTPLFLDEYPVPRTLDEAVRYRMRDLGISQVQFANYARVSQSLISDILARVPGSMEHSITLDKLSSALDMPRSQVVDLAFPVGNIQDNEFNKTLDEIAEEIKAQPRNVQQFAIGFMTGILIDYQAHRIVTGYLQDVKQALPDLPDYTMVFYGNLRPQDIGPVEKVLFQNPEVKTITFYDNWVNRVALGRKPPHPIYRNDNKSK